MNAAILPRGGTARWSKIPREAECEKCWPRPGYGYRPKNPDAQRNFKHLGLPRTPESIAGPCDGCVGTGLKPLPVSEVLPWTPDAWWSTQL